MIESRRCAGCRSDFPPEELPAIEGRFKREAEITMALSHASIPKTFSVGDEQSPYLVQEFINGMNLRDLIPRVASYGESIAVPLASHIVAEVAKALDYIHDFESRGLRDGLYPKLLEEGRPLLDDAPAPELVERRRVVDSDPTEILKPRNWRRIVLFALGGAALVAVAPFVFFRGGKNVEVPAVQPAPGPEPKPAPEPVPTPEPSTGSRRGRGCSAASIAALRSRTKRISTKRIKSIATVAVISPIHGIMSMK
jgi:hypothetical protein